MRLFPRRPSKPDDLGSESSPGLEVVRRVKVTVDRYWVASERSVDASPDKQTLTQQEEDEGSTAP